MIFDFDYSAEIVAKGKEPQIVHMMDNSFLVIYRTEQGIVQGVRSYPLLGLYNELAWEEISRMSPDDDVVYPSLKKVAHHGAYGFWSAKSDIGIDIDHKFVMYMLPMDISAMLVSGTLNYSAGTAVSSASFTFQNIHEELLKRTRSPVAPNVILELYFSMGSSQEISLGRWHIDRASTDIPGNQITVSARNTIGKLLKEQTFDENCTFSAPTFHENLEEILKFAGIEKFFVTESKYNWQLSFDPDTTILSGIEDAIKVISTWQIRENSDGVIGIGRRTDARFEQPSVFSFERERDCFKYSSEYSDEDTYSRLCITREEPEHSFYEELPAHKLWPIPAHRTLYVKVPDGTSVELMHSYAADIKAAIAISGRQETFAARFTPQLMIGDSVRMKTQEQNKIIGVVTSIKHTLGRKGFYTEFTIDSGGRRSKPKLKDYISNISNKKESAYIVTEKDEG